MVVHHHPGGTTINDNPRVIRTAELYSFGPSIHGPGDDLERPGDFGTSHVIHYPNDDSDDTPAALYLDATVWTVHNLHPSNIDDAGNTHYILTPGYHLNVDLASRTVTAHHRP